jgi:bifunctional DNA-binding transcriptional regulator/antitoxin component of YhaV-PrlF toxin-antitoxin module
MIEKRTPDSSVVYETRWHARDYIPEDSRRHDHQDNQGARWRNGSWTTFTLIVLHLKVMAKLSSKNQVTLPVDALRAAGLYPGDEVTVRWVGAGEILIAARTSRVRRHAGIATGIYRPRELDQLRDDWER